MGWDASAYYLYLDDQKIWQWKKEVFPVPSALNGVTAFKFATQFADLADRVYVDYVRAYDWSEPDADILLDDDIDSLIDGPRTNTDYMGRFSEAAVGGGSYEPKPAPGDAANMSGQVVELPATVAAKFGMQFPAATTAKKLRYSLDFYTDAAVVDSRQNYGFGPIYFERYYTKWEGYDLLLFLANGVIKYHNGTTYSTANFTWEINTSYHIELLFDVEALTYDIYVTGGQATEEPLVQNASVAAFADQGLGGLSFGIATRKQHSTPGVSYFDNFKLERTEHVGLKGVAFQGESGMVKTMASPAPVGKGKLALVCNNDLEAVLSDGTVHLTQGESPVAFTGEYDSELGQYIITSTDGLEAETDYKLTVDNVFGPSEFSFRTGKADDFRISEVEWSTLEDGKVQAKVSLSSSIYFTDSKPITVFLCTYEGAESKQLKSVALEIVTVEPGASQEITLSTDYAPENTANLYIWDAASMAPLADTATKTQ